MPLPWPPEACVGMMNEHTAAATRARAAMMNKYHCRGIPQLPRAVGVRVRVRVRIRVRVGVRVRRILSVQSGDRTQ